MICNILSLSHLILTITLWSMKCLHLTHGGKEAFRCWGQSHTVDIIWASQLQIWDYFNCIKLLGHRFTKAGSQTSFMVKSIFNAQWGKYPMVVIRREWVTEIQENIFTHHQHYTVQLALFIRRQSSHLFCFCFPMAWVLNFHEPSFQYSMSSKSVYACVLGCVWLFATPQTIARQFPLSTGFSRQEYWSGLPFPPPGDLPDPETQPTSPVSSACRRILYHYPTKEGPSKFGVTKYL